MLNRLTRHVYSIADSTAPQTSAIKSSDTNKTRENPAPSGRHRATNRSPANPLKTVIRATPQAAATCCPAESYPTYSRLRPIAAANGAKFPCHKINAPRHRASNASAREASNVPGAPESNKTRIPRSNNPCTSSNSNESDTRFAGFSPTPKLTATSAAGTHSGEGGRIHGAASTPNVSNINRRAKTTSESSDPPTPRLSKNSVRSTSASGNNPNCDNRESGSKTSVEQSFTSGANAIPASKRSASEAPRPYRTSSNESRESPENSSKFLRGPANTTEAEGHRAIAPARNVEVTATSAPSVTRDKTTTRFGSITGRETRKSAYREANEAAENEGTAHSIKREKTSTYTGINDGSNESASGSINEPNNSAAGSAANASIDASRSSASASAEVFANDQLQLRPRLCRHRCPVRDYRVFQSRMALTNYALRYPRHRRRH